MLEICRYFKDNEWGVLHKDRHLLQRERKKFSQTPFINIKIWHDRIQFLKEQQKLIAKETVNDIHRWQGKRPKKPGENKTKLGVKIPGRQILRKIHPQTYNN